MIARIRRARARWWCRAAAVLLAYGLAFHALLAGGRPADLAMPDAAWCLAAQSGLPFRPDHGHRHDHDCGSLCRFAAGIGLAVLPPAADNIAFAIFSSTAALVARHRAAPGFPPAAPRLSRGPPRLA